MANKKAPAKTQINVFDLDRDFNHKERGTISILNDLSNKTDLVLYFSETKTNEPYLLRVLVLNKSLDPNIFFDIFNEYYPHFSYRDKCPYFEVRNLTKEIFFTALDKKFKVNKKLFSVEGIDHTKEKSPSWDTVSEILKTLKPGEKIPGALFNEGFPKITPLGRKYKLILASGENILDAEVDFSKEYMSEGLQWRTPRGAFVRYNVAAWIEYTG